MGQLRRNGYKKKEERKKEERIEREGRSRGTERGREMVSADKHRKIKGKVKSNNEKGRSKKVQKRRKKTRV